MPDPLNNSYLPLQSKVPFFGLRPLPLGQQRPMPALQERSCPSRLDHAVQIRAHPHRGINSRFGDRLRDLRKERKMTQLVMAMDFGIDRSFISDVERGKKSISLVLLEVIALGLEINLSDLLRGL
jgi:DNA-binding XRE family transcriptional regulator